MFDKIKKAFSDNGMLNDPDNQNKESVEFEIAGMTCDHCATGIKKMLSQNEGVKEANVSYPKATCECSFDPTKTSKEETAV